MKIGRNGDLKNPYPIGRGRDLKPAPESRENCIKSKRREIAF